jgi:hypothetical protein
LPRKSDAIKVAMNVSGRPHYEYIARALVWAILLVLLFFLYVTVPKDNAVNWWNRSAFLFYDNSTDSYSVKLFQAVLWFLTVFPVVLYAFILTRLQSGTGVHVSVPANILYVLGTSAATAVIASGVESMRSRAPVKSADKVASWRDLFLDNESFSFPRFQSVLDDRELRILSEPPTTPALRTIRHSSPISRRACGC